MMRITAWSPRSKALLMVLALICVVTVLVGAILAVASSSPKKTTAGPPSSGPSLPMTVPSPSGSPTPTLSEEEIYTQGREGAKAMEELLGEPEPMDPTPVPDPLGGTLTPDEFTVGTTVGKGGDGEGFLTDQRRLLFTSPTKDPYPSVDKSRPGWWRDPELKGLSWEQLMTIPVPLAPAMQKPEKVARAAIRAWMDVDPARDRGTEDSRLRAARFMTAARSKQDVTEYTKSSRVLDEAFTKMVNAGTHQKVLRMEEGGFLWGEANPDSGTQVWRSVQVTWGTFDDEGKAATPPMDVMYTFLLNNVGGTWLIADHDMRHPWYQPPFAINEMERPYGD